MELSVGQVFGDYEILGVLGAGGMGKVYQVRNKISNRIEAMKILLSNLTVEPELVDRFTREIRIFGSLDHPNIAELRTALRVENQLVMIMEFVEGSTLDALMKKGRIPMEKYVDYMRQALAALSYAHSKGVVHRDIKPANMMLTPSGVLKLMDFGIAKAVSDPKLTKTGLMVGSVYYVSPEQIEGRDLDGRSDLYSLGVTLYELATGKRPFDGNSDYQIISAHMKENPPAPRELDASLPAELNDIIMLALERDPAQRFQTADAFRNALDNVRTAGRPPQAVPALPPNTPSPKVAARQNTRLMYMLAGSLATIAVIVGAVIEIPKLMHTSAQSTAAPPPMQTPPAQTADTPAETAPPAASPPASAPPAEPIAPTLQPVKKDTVKPAPAPPGKQQAQIPVQPSPPPQAQPSEPRPTQPPPAQPPPAQPVQAAPAPNAAAVAELRERANLMSVRVATVRSFLQNLQRRQAASGLGMRGDMVAADQRLGYQLEQAEASLQQGDAASAKKRLDAAERDLETLEKFTGH
jgi:serine/threonine protein kinase